MVTLEHVIDKKPTKWILWFCKKCLKEFSSAKECKKHLEQLHAADFKPLSAKHMVKRTEEAWAHKIRVGSWEPVDAVAAADMIKNGWFKEWPLARDDERRQLLMEIKDFLARFCELKILPCSVRDWMMQYPFRHLGKLEVSEQSFAESHLSETPQSICFLESPELIQILSFLKTIECERNDGTDLVCKAVDSVLARTRVKEKIDFDSEYSLMLLDRRLLKSNIASYDEEGKISIISDPNKYYAKAHAQGDDIISWLTDDNSVDKTFLKPIREHNFGFWMAVLKAFQFTCRTLATKYAKKVQVFEYHAALTEVERICIDEDIRTRNPLEDQRSMYASLLRDSCEAITPENSQRKNFLCAARDILVEESCPTFDFPTEESCFKDCLHRIHEHRSLSDNKVWQSIEHLRSVATKKALQIDSEILLIDNARIKILDNLTGLSLFDNRTYIFQLLKPFLLNEIKKMESDTADLLTEVEKKKPQSKKKNNKSKKDTSRSKSTPLDKTMEHKPSINLEPECSSSSLRTVDEDCMGLLEISSTTEIQEEATKDDSDMKNMPGENSLSAHLESAPEQAAVLCDPLFEMTVRALLNIKVLKEVLKKDLVNQPLVDHQEEPVRFALRNLFVALVSEEINKEEVFRVLLSDLYFSLEDVLCTSIGANDVFVAIFDYWSCWKNSESESLGNRLFTMTSYERVRCGRCKKNTNYPLVNSNGIQTRAYCIRELKCAVGNLKFVDILKIMRMEYTHMCDIKTGGCLGINYVTDIISRCPPVFPIVLTWERSETENEIAETIKAIDWEIDISILYKESLEPNTNYRLVSMVGCGEGEEYICLAFVKNLWVNLRRFAREVVGDWEKVLGFCGERKFRPEILFYEAA